MILHIDMNAYFATMEQQANPFLRGRPILVCGKGSGERTVVATASYEAKRLGVKTGMAVWEAKKLVPEAIIVAADYDRYLDITRRLGVIFEHYTPYVEFFSIDEAFLRISAGGEAMPQGGSKLAPQEGSIRERSEVRSQERPLLPKSPQATEADHCSRALPPVAREPGPALINIVEQKYATAIKCAEQIKQDIKRKLGQWVTCSIGIAPNKLLAKIASEFRKPDGLTVIAQNTGVQPAIHSRSGLLLSHRELYNQIKLDDIPGIGPRILRRLLQLGITSPHILGQTSLPILVKEFGNHQGQVLYNLGRGIDRSPVTRNELMPEEKSFSHSYTLPKEIYTYEDARKVLLELCEMVGRRMRKKGFASRTISVFLRFTDMTTAFERKTFKEYTNSGLQIFRAGEWLLQKTWAFKNKRVAKPLAQARITEDSAGLGGRRGDRGRNRVPGRDLPLEQINSRRAKQWGEPGPAYFSYKPIRQVGIWVTNLTHERNLPLPLFEGDRRQLKALKAMDQINDKYGEFTLMRGPVLEIYKKVQKIPDGRNKRQFNS